MISIISTGVLSSPLDGSSCVWLLHTEQAGARVEVACDSIQLPTCRVTKQLHTFCWVDSGMNRYLTKNQRIYFIYKELLYNSTATVSFLMELSSPVKRSVCERQKAQSNINRQWIIIILFNLLNQWEGN